MSYVGIFDKYILEFPFIMLISIIFTSYTVQLFELKFCFEV